MIEQITPSFSQMKLTFRQTKLTTDWFAELESKSPNGYWRDLNSDWIAYQKTFEQVMEGENFPGILRNLKQNNRVVAVDFAGNGSVYTSLPEDARPDVIIATTLHDIGSEQKEIGSREGVFRIKGNIFLPSFWHKFDNLCESLEIESYSIGTLRMVAGIKSMPTNEDPYKVAWFYDWQENEICKRLNPQRGFFFGEAPKELLRAFPYWINRPRKTTNTKITYALASNGQNNPNEQRPIYKIERHCL